MVEAWRMRPCPRIAAPDPMSVIQITKHQSFLIKLTDGKDKNSFCFMMRTSHSFLLNAHALAAFLASAECFTTNSEQVLLLITTVSFVGGSAPRSRAGSRSGACGSGEPETGPTTRGLFRGDCAAVSRRASRNCRQLAPVVRNLGLGTKNPERFLQMRACTPKISNMK